MRIEREEVERKIPEVGDRAVVVLVHTEPEPSVEAHYCTISYMSQKTVKVEPNPPGGPMRYSPDSFQHLTENVFGCFAEACAKRSQWSGNNLK
jgi:hypothetical protein